MRFIATFIAIAIGAFALTWYLNYDYNLFEYQLLQSCVKFVYRYFTNEELESARKPPKIVDSDDVELCWSWDVMLVLLQQVHDNVETLSERVEEDAQFMDRLGNDIRMVDLLIDDFDHQIEKTTHALPKYLEPVNIVLQSMQHNIHETHRTVVNSTVSNFGLVESDQVLFKQKKLDLLRAAVETADKLAEANTNTELTCMCRIVLELRELSEKMIEQTDACVVDVERGFRDVYNGTIYYMNSVMDETSTLIESSKTKPISTVDNLLHLPIFVRNFSPFEFHFYFEILFVDFISFSFQT